MTQQTFVNRNEYGQKREAFFKGIEAMLKDFSDEDLKRMRTIVFNELFDRKKNNLKDKGVIIGV